MSSYTKKLGATLLFVVLIMGACVTINIYFPAEKVESVAGEIVKEVRGEKDSGKSSPADDGKSSLWEKTDKTKITILSWMSSVSWAQDVTGVSNPTIRGLKEQMKRRFGQMKPYYTKGMLKEGNDGFVKAGGTTGLSLKEKRNLKGLVTAENKDRRQLYDAVAKALNIDPSQIDRVGEIFAKEWQKTVN